MQRAQFEVNDRTGREHWWFRARREILVALVERLAPAGSRGADVRCGTGANLAVLARRPD